MEDEDIEAADKWLVEGSYQELGIDAVCEGELFFKELPLDCDRNKFEAELERIKQLIVKVESDWIYTNSESVSYSHHKPMNPELSHPLAKVEIIATESGYVPVMNSWALASFIWFAIKQNNPEALKMALELFPDPNKIDLLQTQNDEAAFRQAKR